MTRDASASARQIRSLTSLRFFAAVAVLCFHYFGFRFGRLGVSFFYVLSGFVLTYIYDERLRSRAATTDFFVRRVARIYPTHLLMFFVGLPVFLHLAQAYLHAGALWTGTAAAANLLLLHSWWPDHNVYLGFETGSWSLSDEAFFYAMCPLLLGLRNLRVVGLALAVVMVGTLGLVVARPSEFALWLFYVNPTFRLLEFLVGIGCCRLLANGRRLLSGTPGELAALGSLGAAMIVAYALPAKLELLTYSIIFIVPSALIVASFAQEAGAISKLLRGALFVELGEGSYALYLTHEIAFVYALHIIDGLAFRVVLAVLVIGLSIVVHRLYELPARRRIIRWHEDRADRRRAREYRLFSDVL